MNTELKSSNYGFVTATVLPDGNGGFTPCPEILTESEAVRYLRLDTINIQNPSATLRRYREAGLLRAVQISKGVFYPRAELDQFIKASMEKNPR